MFASEDCQIEDEHLHHDNAPRVQYHRPVLRRGLADMREVNGFFLFELGQLPLLTLLPRDVDLRPSAEFITEIRKHLREFSETNENREDLPDAVGVAIELVRLLTVVLEKNPFPSITMAEYSRAGYLVLTFRDRLHANLGKLYSEILEDKGGRSVKTLWLNPLKLIDTRIIPNLSDFVVFNIMEAAKCWVVDRPTATGFHMMRCVESVLRQYKKLITGKEFQRTSKKGRVYYEGFGTLIDELDGALKDLKDANASFGQLEFAIGILRPLSKLYRDPLSHPELKELNEEDAKLAFEQGLSAIARMVADCLDGGTHFKVPHTAGVKF